MRRINGIVETALYVKDLARSQEFYERVLGFREIFREETRMRAMAITDGNILLLFRVGASTQGAESPGGRIPPHDGSGNLHVAFGIPRDQVDVWRERLAAEGVAIESEVDTPYGGRSLYFRDPDGHCLELITPGSWSVY